MMLYSLLLIGLLCSVTRSQFNLYNTDASLDAGNLHTNCLHHYVYYWIELTEKVEYCVGPISDNDILLEKFPNTTNGNFTFDELRQLNVITQELLAWSAAIDLIERYQYYIDQPNNSFKSTEIFFNCTKPWFGPRCQYSFGLDTIYMLPDIVRKTFTKKYYSAPPYVVTSLTCYIHLKCDRGGSNICLDWREICDGRIDCIDGGIDEDQCFQLEINECNENEYRCRNGLCISKGFLKDERSQCLDGSDSLDIIPYPAQSGYRHIFDIEEHMCPLDDKQFKCGDGRCVADYDKCLNKRDLFLYELISMQGNLSSICWITMICLTKILNQVNGTSCQQFFKSSNITTYLESCETIIQFPIVPVLFGHIRFLYILNDTKHGLNTDLALIPDYICYDSKLCDFLIPTFRIRNYTCRHSRDISSNLIKKLTTWTSIISVIEPYFRKCLTTYNNTNLSQYSSLIYCCKNSSKCISKHRILDNISDCYLNDDEEQFELSCLINDTRRFKCGNENKCYAVFVSQEICPQQHLLTIDKIDFKHLCDRYIEMSPVIIDGQNYTDESECEKWPCNNVYTRCDGFWSCPSGEDEDNCTERQICPSGSLACVSPYDYTLTCLPADQVNDNHIDCLGAADELQYCRSGIWEYETYSGFHCWNDSKCIKRNRLCDNDPDCSFEDDEVFCGEDKSCSQCDKYGCSNVTEALCRIGTLSKARASLETLPVYPLLSRKTIQYANQPQIELHSLTKYITKEPHDHTWPWRCNHGLYVTVWSGDNSLKYKCFCPPHYYGDLCQYQNQRVSFTMKVNTINRYGIHAMIITLIDDDDDRQQINSYHQFISTSTRDCDRVYNTYLTYLSRPKNTSTNHSVRVDVFDKTPMRYIGSWHFSVPFSFLPNNRMAVLLSISDHPPSNIIKCSVTCHNGKCAKYMNKETGFCQCNMGWSGVRCDIPIRCNDCSSDSLCVGMIHNRSICVCPLNKGGPRCLITLSCPENYCDNNGSCLVVDDGINELGFVCVCSENFNGVLCDIEKPIFEISFHNIKVSSPILSIYIFTDIATTADFDKMELTVVSRNLKMFERTVSLNTPQTLRAVFAKIDNSYYLAYLQRHDQVNVSTSIDSSQRCLSIDEVLNSELRVLPKIRRMKYYHVICQTKLHLLCFFDESHMCLCTLERHAFCFKFEHNTSECRYTTHCQNNAKCMEEGTECPVTTFCSCIDCYFGDQCQFYAKGVGLTLDDIFRYDIQPNATMHEQSSVIKWYAAFTMIILVAGLINSFLSFITFRIPESRLIGCGIYLLASSITSLLTVSMLTFKFWFHIITQINPLTNVSTLRSGCQSLEFLLKVCLYMDNWLNACVALERFMTVYTGVRFDKLLSKRSARWVIIILALLIPISIIHEPLYRNLAEDKHEQRLWCVILYSPSVHTYNTIISFFHFLCPFCANLFSAVFIIFHGARQRARLEPRLTYRQHLSKQFAQHKHLIISSILLVILSIPRLIISFLSGCVKASHNSPLYAAGYLVSFVPSVSVFIVFVLPSEFYMKQFKKAISSCQPAILRR
ncbi:unnamed protein product [Adineta steineri]|uniref:Uncharacterized protein n=1 Tax=Adineta steineri TaxID=433720 RepID=A0A815DDZ4_9BILA|nr:unnamed protein product [Adineta steineri]CAF1296780.1 unnamed protein product [Adineta steineri]